MQAKHGWLRCGLLVASVGALFGTGRLQAQYTNLHEFGGGASDGQNPAYASLTLSGTNLYGMTDRGGVNNSGVVFKVSTDGSGYTNLHNFVGGAGDGAEPAGSLTLAGTNLCGVTDNGGASGLGLVFQIHADGSGYTKLHSFAGGAGDGASPHGSLTLSGTNLYGMTYAGGVYDKGVFFPNYKGVVFKVNADGSGYTNLHEFAGGAGDGADPIGSLTLSGTNLYGMTLYGGVHDAGVVFKVNADGSGYTNLHEFAGGAGDGREPYGSLTLSGPNLYGMTWAGGASNKGVVFRLHTDGSGYTNLHEFAGGAGDGQSPAGDLTLSGAYLYGMTYAGGASNKGVVFQLHAKGSGYVNLHEFIGGAGDGAQPFGSLALTGTNLYGMTSSGGASNNGVVFALALSSTARPAQVFFQDGGGLVASWLLATNGNFQSARLLGAAGAWQLLAAGDVDGDGISDLLFQTPAGDTAGWLLNTNGAIRGVIQWGNVGAWKLRACADYTGEGVAQLFFQDPSGTVAFWHLSTNGLFQSAEVLVHAGGWRLCAAIPHAVDGPADLYWQTVTGLVAVWQQQPFGGVLAQLIGGTAGWRLCGAADMDGDGVGDLLWQTADGMVAGWFMNSNNTMRASISWWNTGGWKLKAGGR